MDSFLYIYANNCYTETFTKTIFDNKLNT